MKKIKIILLIIFFIITVVLILNIKSTVLNKNATETQLVRNASTQSSDEYQGLIIVADNLVANTTEETIIKENTLYLQNCIDTVSNAGGGIVHIPSGIYYFKPIEGKGRDGVSYCIIECKDNVIVQGAGVNDSTGTILKPYAPDSSLPVDMFYFNDYAETKGENATFLVNADFKDFIVDGENASCSIYNSAGKGFMINLFKNCDWDNVVVKNTDGTGFGVDCPINSTIKNCIAINCGKAASESNVGASGFGIGTGYSNDESIIISNCTAIANKKYGFFFEHQSRFASRGTNKYLATKSDSLVVSNCKASGNLYDFGGARANDVTYENCISYVNEENDRTVSSIHFENISRRTHIINCKVDREFTDVTDSKRYYYDSVYWARDNSIAEGISKTEFGVEEQCKRIQAIVFLYRMDGRQGEVAYYSRNRYKYFKYRLDYRIYRYR